MDENIKNTKLQTMTLTIRRADARDVVISSIIYSLIICTALNSIFYIMNKENYIKTIYNLSIFNILPTTLIFFITIIVYSYCLFIESTIQFRKRKYYYKYEDKSYSIIFSLTISLAFSFINTLFLLITAINFFQIHGKEITRYRIGVTTLIILVFGILSAFIYSFYYKIVKILLFKSLLLKEKFFSSIKENIDQEIHSAKINHWDLWLVSLTILNMDEISNKLKIRRKKIIKEIIYNLTHSVKSSDMIFTLNHYKGIIGYLVKNIDASIIDNFIKTKIVPLLEKEMIVKNTHFDLKVEYAKENLGKSSEVESINDIISNLK